MEAHHRGLKALKLALLAVAVLYLVAYAATALFRLGYPFELEWLEGGALDQVRQLVLGRPLYVRPSLEYVPFIYPPLYFYVSAALAKLVGLSFLPLRLVSFVASLGCLALIFLIIRRETRSVSAALLGSGLFAATYSLGGAWLDIARVDSLFLFFLLVTAYLARSGSLLWWALAGVAGTLAFLTKQTAVGFVAPLLLYGLLTHRRRFLVFLVSFVGLVALSTWLLDWIHRGWYSYYLFRLTTGFSVVPRMLLRFLVKDTLLPLGLAVGVGAAFLVGRWRKGDRAGALFYGLLVLGWGGGSAAARMVLGGGRNALLPIYAALAILFALGVVELQAVLCKPAGRRYAQTGFYLVCLAQFAVLAYWPARHVPTRQDRMVGHRLVAALRETPGEVLMPYHGHVPRMAGKRGSAQWMAMGDVLGLSGGRLTPPGENLTAEIRQRICEKRYSAIYLDRNWDLFQADIERHYVRRRAFFNAGDIYPIYNAEGQSFWPLWVYVPRDDDQESQ